MYRFSLKIVALNKTKERMRPYHVIHENEDPDIKKIKKVNDTLFQVELVIHVSVFSATCLPQFPPSDFLQVCEHVARTVCLSYLVGVSSGAEFHAGLALSQKVEDHRSGLHLLSPC